MGDAMWNEFECEVNFESEVLALAMYTLTSAVLAWPHAMPLKAFAFNVWSADGAISISLSSHPCSAVLDPPDWEHECADTELAEVAQAWRERYGPIRALYQERFASPDYAHGFLLSVRRVLVRMERLGAFAAHPGIRTLVTEVDADVDAEARLLDDVRRSVGDGS